LVASKRTWGPVQFLLAQFSNESKPSLARSGACRNMRNKRDKRDKPRASIKLNCEKSEISEKRGGLLILSYLV
jgi:hypothetical protein